MSRIILSKYDNGEERVVVGWDHPCGGAFWQEFNLEPEGEEYSGDWEEVLRSGGFLRGIPLADFRASVPEDLRPFVTDRVMGLLEAHAEDLDSGYNTASIDMASVP
jgi:hypothetical protein